MKRLIGIPIQFLTYLAFRGLERFVTLFPLRICGATGSALGWAVGLISGPYRRLARRNLRIALRDQVDESEIRALTSKHFRALGRNFCCSLKIARMTTGEAEALVTYEGKEHIENAVAAGKGIIGAIAHIGPWELLAQLPSLGRGVAPGTMYQPLANRFINQFIVSRRGKSGAALFDRSTGVHGPVKHIRNGGGVGVLIDQHAGDHGIWCPFFGRLASTTNLPALLSLRSGAPVISMLLLPDGPYRWKVIYYPPYFPSPGADRQAHAAGVTAGLNRELESVVRRAPEEWFWVHNRWKTPKPRLLLSGYRRGLHLSDEEKADLKPFRMLIRSPNPLGDACMAIPAVRAIRPGRPDLHLTVLCRENVAPVWRCQPEVDEVLVIPRGASILQTARLVREKPDFDAAVLLPNSLRVGLEAYLGKVVRRIGYRGHTRRWLLNQIVPPPKIGPTEHHVWSYLRIAETIGAKIEEAERFFAVPDPPPADGEEGGRLGVCPGAEYGAAKRWPVDRFGEVANEVHRKTACRVSVFGSPGEMEIGEAFAKAVDFSCDNRVGKTSIEELIEELKRCRVVLTNDTGTMHLAAMLGVPTVSIFGSTDPHWTRPIGGKHRVIRRHVECGPCFLRECPIDFRCMHEIDSQQVIDAVLELLGSQAPLI